MAAAVANAGKQMRPFVVQQLLGADTTSLDVADPKPLQQSCSPQVAASLQQMMMSVVQNGTGRQAKIEGYQVGGKTGTAELVPNSSNPKDADAWFVAFAPASKPKVAVGVMLVGAGFGGTAAAPIARRVLQAALQ